MIGRDVSRDMGDHYILTRFLSNGHPELEASSGGGGEQVVIVNQEESPYTERVPQWGEEEVAAWLRTIGFGDFCDVFRSVGVDGDILLLLTEASMREDLEITNGILRKRFQRELRQLKRTSDYSCCGGQDTADFLNRISCDSRETMREFTYNLISKDMTLEHMKSLSKEDLVDMLKDAGIDNIVHQHKICDAVEALWEEGSYRSVRSSIPSSFVSSEVSPQQYDVYLTCPLASGAELASLIKMQLEIKGISVYFNDNSRDSGSGSSLSQQKVKLIQDTRHFVLVLVPGALDSCRGERAEAAGGDSKLHDEVVTALQAGANIVPVILDFQWPSAEELRPEVREVAFFNCVRWVHEYQDACIEKLERFIRPQAAGDNFLRIDSPFSNILRTPRRSRTHSGVSTPASASKAGSRKLSEAHLSTSYSFPAPDRSGFSTPASASRSGSRRPSEAPLSMSLLERSLLNVPRNLRKSNVSIDSGLEAHC